MRYSDPGQRLNEKTRKTGHARVLQRNSNIEVEECPDLLSKVLEFTEMVIKHKKIADDCSRKISFCREEKKKMLKTIHFLRVEPIATALQEEFQSSRTVTVKVQDLTDELKKIQNMDSINDIEIFAKKRVADEMEKETDKETSEDATYKRQKRTA